jgi:predicted secreted protein
MFLRRALIVFLVLVDVPAYAMVIKAPDIAENGAVIPVEIKLDKPMTAGQHLDLQVNGELAARVRVMEGKLSTFSTRVQAAHNDTVIAARVMANGSEIESASRNVHVTITAQINGLPTSVGSMKERKSNGEIKLLLNSENGFAGTLVLQDTGFHVEISGSSIIAKNPLVSASGEFSDQITASFNALSPTDMAEAKGRADEAKAKQLAAAAAAKRLADEAKTKQTAAESEAKSKRLAEEAEAKRQAVIKGIAREKDREVAAIEQQERDEQDAKEKEKAEKAFQASLSKLNAGELYALADTKRNVGETDKAREILRTLITKFPNNPLVALAAQQMTQIKPSAPAAAPATPKPPAPSAQNKATNRDTGLEEMAGAFSAPKK